MTVGDHVVVISKDVIKGVKRPSFAVIISEDGDKLLVRSLYQSLTNVVENGYKEWIVSRQYCVKIETSFMDSVLSHTDPVDDFEPGELVKYIRNCSYPEKKLTEVIEGVVVKVTDKTVEIMVNGTTEIRRKNKSLVMRA